MTTHTRRSFVALAGISGLGFSSLAAQDHSDHGDMDATCQAGKATPAVVPYESDIPFDLAYIDSMIPHHASVVALAETALTSLEDERLVEIAQAVLDTQPGEMEQLQAFRDEWYPDEPTDISDDRMMEMMMVTMAGSMYGCSPMDLEDMTEDDDAMDHMMLMDSEALVQAYEEAEDKDLTFIDLVVPHHQMAVRQSQVGLELAEHEELRALLDGVIEAQTAEIDAMLEIRDEINHSGH